MKTATVVETPSQFLKAAPLGKALRRAGHEHVLIHAGDRSEYESSRPLLEQIGIVAPEVHLKVGFGASGSQAGQGLAHIEEQLRVASPDWLLVFGDTNTTLSAALVAAKLDIPVAHLEAGERTFRRKNDSGELNRVLTDHASHLCLTSTRRGREYLLREGMPPERVHFVGDPMCDVFQQVMAEDLLDRFTTTPESLGLSVGSYHLALLQHPANIDDRNRLQRLIEVLGAASQPVVFPAPTRFLNTLEGEGIKPQNNLRLIEPLTYCEVLRLLLACDKCVTDSKDVMRDAYFARTPCIVPLDGGYWEALVESGWTVESGRDAERLVELIEAFSPVTTPPANLFGEGHSAESIVTVLEEEAEGEGAWHPRGRRPAFDGGDWRDPPFTYATYRELLNAFLERGYRFRPFDAAEQILEREETALLLRHDIDLSLEAALRMAEIEAELGVASTYFFMLRTDHYNVLSDAGTQTVRRILRLGHSLGLHFDRAAYSQELGISALREACNRECRILEEWFECDVSIVSYHRPGDLILSGNPELSAPRPHTYMPRYTEAMQYRSDSAGRWRYGHPTDAEAFRRGAPIHLLIHPLWWRQEPASSYNTLHDIAQRKQEHLHRSIAANCSAFRHETSKSHHSSETR